MPSLFLSQEKLAEKLAHVLNYTLDNFTSSKGNNLKVKDKEKYYFDPKSILKNVVEIYISFSSFPKFLELIAKDQRSFKIENFERVDTLKNKGVIKVDLIKYQAFIEMSKKLKQLHSQFKSEQVLFEDAPNEFLDALTSTIMNDPVMLPSSKSVIDRQNIETHLLSYQNDPFDRSPLTKDKLIPVEDLKRRIDEYKASRLNNK
jgi:ubiquitin conjugation factor E4 B